MWNQNMPIRKMIPCLCGSLFLLYLLLSGDFLIKKNMCYKKKHGTPIAWQALFLCYLLTEPTYSVPELIFGVTFNKICPQVISPKSTVIFFKAKSKSSLWGSNPSQVSIVFEVSPSKCKVFKRLVQIKSLRQNPKSVVESFWGKSLRGKSKLSQVFKNQV